MPSRRNPYPSTSNDYATGFDPYEDGGIAGTGRTVVQDAPPAPGVPPPAAPPASTPPPTPPQTYGYTGYDPSKMEDPTHNTGKYAIGKTLRGFDPSLGINSDVINALNGLGYANFSNYRGEGERLKIDGITDKGREAGLQNGWIGDFIDNFTDSDHSKRIWRYDSGAGAHAAPKAGGGAGGGVAGGGGGQVFDLMGGGGAGSGGDGGGGSASSHPSIDMNQIMSWLKPMIEGGGGFNEGAVNRRLDTARGALERQKKSTLDSQRAIMADRGLLSEGTNHQSGAEITNLGRVNQDISDQFSGQLNSIYADEADRADDRMISALQMATGMTTEEARNAVQYAGIASSERLGHERNNQDFTLGQGNLALGNRRAGQDFTLGKGQLALGNVNASNDWNKFLANYGLDREKFQFDQQNHGTDQLMEIMRLLGGGADNSSGGFI